MCSSKIQVIGPDNDIETLDLAVETTLKRILRAVADGGWVVLQESTKVDADSAKKDIVENKVRLLLNG